MALDTAYYRCKIWPMKTMAEESDSGSDITSTSFTLFLSLVYSLGAQINTQASQYHHTLTTTPETATQMCLTHNVTITQFPRQRFFRIPQT